MRRPRSLAALLLACPVLIQAQPWPDSTLEHSYRVFHGHGAAASLDAVVAASEGVDVLYVGEEHDDPVAHYVEHRLLERLRARMEKAGRSLVLSLEMFERDAQLVLDEFLAGLITERHFLQSARPWTHYETDYRSLILLAKEHGIPVIASNAPRRYVNRVSREGAASLEALSVWGKAWLPPLPVVDPSPAYRAKWVAAADSGSHAADSMSVERMLEAQSLWDAAMAHSISEMLKAAPGALVIHIAGSFHVEEGLGIPSRVKALRRLIVVVRTAEDFTVLDAEEYGHLGDFVIQTDASLRRAMTP